MLMDFGGCVHLASFALTSMTHYWDFRRAFICVSSWMFICITTSCSHSRYRDEWWPVLAHSLPRPAVYSTIAQIAHSLDNLSSGERWQFEYSRGIDVMVGNALGCHDCWKLFLKDVEGFGIGRTLSVDSKLSTKAPKAVGNSRGSYPRIKLWGLMDEIQRLNKI